MRFGVSQSTVKVIVTPPATPALKFNVRTNSQYVPLISF